MSRHLLGELAWRALQVFVSALLVGFGAGDYLTALRSVAFWQDVAGAATIAVVSQLLALATYHVQVKRCDKLGGGQPDPTGEGETDA